MPLLPSPPSTLSPSAIEDEWQDVFPSIETDGSEKSRPFRRTTHTQALQNSLVEGGLALGFGNEVLDALSVFQEKLG